MIPKEKLKKDEWAVTLDYLSHGDTAWTGPSPWRR